MRLSWVCPTLESGTSIPRETADRRYLITIPASAKYWRFTNWIKPLVSFTRKFASNVAAFFRSTMPKIKNLFFWGRQRRILTSSRFLAPRISVLKHGLQEYLKEKEK